MGACGCLCDSVRNWDHFDVSGKLRVIAVGGGVYACGHGLTVFRLCIDGVQLRLSEEKEAEEDAKRRADYRREDFNLAERVKELCLVQSSDVQITKHTASGWIKKLGSARKNWTKRWFVLDVRDQSVKYFATDKSTKEKNGFELVSHCACTVLRRTCIHVGFLARERNGHC